MGFCSVFFFLGGGQRMFVVRCLFFLRKLSTFAFRRLITRGLLLAIFFYVLYTNFI